MSDPKPEPVILKVSQLEVHMSEGIIPAMYVRMAEIAKDSPAKMEENFDRLIKEMAVLLAASRANDAKVLTVAVMRFVDFCMASEDAKDLLKKARGMGGSDASRN